MPIYEFECSTCRTRFDRLQKLSDPDPGACPECGEPTIRRCVTAPSFRLAGSGWYETDFKKDGDKKRNLVDKVEAKKSEDKKPDGGKSEGGASEGGKSEGGRSEGGKSEGGKSESKPAEKAQAAKPESKPAPAADN